MKEYQKMQRFRCQGDGDQLQIWGGAAAVEERITFVQRNRKK